MTVQELIEELQNCDPEAEVRLAEQPRWAFEYSIREVAEVKAGSERADEMEEELDKNAQYLDDDEREEMKKQIEALRRDVGEETIVYIAEGSQLGYLPHAAHEALNW